MYKNLLRVITLTKEKIRCVLKRLPYIIQTIDENKTEAFFYIAKRRERIVIDDETRAVVEIFDEIINSENAVWLKDIFVRVKKGKKDVYIMIDSPLGRGKYYLIKERLINKIDDCCIYRGLVSYADILNEGMG